MATIYEIIREKLPLPGYIEQVTGEQFTKTGDTYKMICPFPEHKETDGSFTVFMGDKGWKYYCHGCGEKGDIFDFEEKYKGGDKVEVRNRLASMAGVSIEQYDKTSKKRSLVSDGRVRDFIQDYLRKTLEKDDEGVAYCEARGASKEIREQWGIGMSDGKTWQTLRKRILDKNDMPMDGLLNKIGICWDHNKSKQLTEVFSEDKLTLPVYIGREISHWHLRDVGKHKSRYQMKKETWHEEYRFFNQVSLKYKNIWFSEGPFDVISLEKSGRHAIGMMGYSTAKIEYLCELKEINEVSEDLTERKTFHVIFDRDKNKSGQKTVNRFAKTLARYHNVLVYILPMGKDVDEFLREGGKIEDLERIEIRPESSKVRVDKGCYWVINENGKSRPISNFIVKRKYRFIEDEKTRYQVSLIQDDGQTKTSIDFDANDFTNANCFNQWLGFQGDYIYEGGQNELIELRKYWKNHEKPRDILVKDMYGRVFPDLWLGHNGIIYKGEIVYSGPDSVSTLDAYGLDGIKSNVSKSNDLYFNIPKKFFTVEEIITNMLRFWPPKMVWKMIGFGAAMYYHNIIRGKYKKFPVFAMYGESTRGKTSGATVTASLLGAGDITDPAGDSTSKGVGRLLSALNSLPVIVNEYDTRRMANLVRATYDRNQDIKAQMTNDLRIHSMQKNTSLIITSENIPKEISVLNRLVGINYWNFKKRQGKNITTEFLDYEHQAVIENKNIGFLIAMTRAGGEGQILQDIQNSMKAFAMASERADSRQIYNFGVVYGSMTNAFRVLGIPKILEKLKIPEPDNAEILNEYESSVKMSDKLIHEEDPLKVFFTHFEILYSTGRLDKLADIDRGNDILKFHMNNVLTVVKMEDKKSDGKLQGVSASDLKQSLRTRFKSVNHCSWKPKSSESGKPISCYTISLDEIDKIIGVDFEYNYDRSYGE